MLTESIKIVQGSTGQAGISSVGLGKFVEVIPSDPEEKKRDVWVNPAAVASFSEFFPWRAVAVRPRWTRIALLNGSYLVVTCIPESVANWLKWGQS